MLRQLRNKYYFPLKGREEFEKLKMMKKYIRWKLAWNGGGCVDCYSKHGNKKTLGLFLEVGRVLQNKKQKGDL